MAFERIEDGLSEGDTLTFAVTSNFIVDYYDGTKSIVVSTTTGLGGRNAYWGQSLLTIGVIVVVVAALLVVSCFLCPICLRFCSSNGNRSSNAVSDTAAVVGDG